MDEGMRVGQVGTHVFCCHLDVAGEHVVRQKLHSGRGLTMRMRGGSRDSCVQQYYINAATRAAPTIAQLQNDRLLRICIALHFKPVFVTKHWW